MTKKPHEKTILLMDYVKKRQAGDKISFLEIEHDTNVTMDLTGKGYLRTALKSTGTPFLSIRGYGIELVSEKTSVEAVGVHFCKINNAVKRGEREANLIYDKFSDKMDEATHTQIGNIVCFFAEVNSCARMCDTRRKIQESRLRPASVKGVPELYK